MKNATVRNRLFKCFECDQAFALVRGQGRRLFAITASEDPQRLSKDNLIDRYYCESCFSRLFSKVPASEYLKGEF